MTTPRLGWLPDLPDIRDYTLAHEDVGAILAKSNRYVAAARGPLPTADLRQWCSPVDQQGGLGSCTSHAASAMIEYFEKRAFGSYIDASRLFIYKASRNLMGVKGDTGSYLRTTMQSIAMFGSPPESMWPYVESKYDVEPTAFLYAMASNYKATRYYRLDPNGATRQVALQNLRTNLSAGLPAMFGFTVYSSMPGFGAPDDHTGNIPFPVRGDRVQGGHAVLAVGYDDNRMIAGKKGAVLIRNSWGKDWGFENGHGWLPYEYILQGLADDFWSLVQASFVDTGLFK